MLSMNFWFFLAFAAIALMLIMVGFAASEYSDKESWSDKHFKAQNEIVELKEDILVLEAELAKRDKKKHKK